MSNNNIQQQVEKLRGLLKTGVSASEMKEAKSLLAVLKISLIELSSNNDMQSKEMMCDIAELACFYSIYSGDLPSYERHYQLVKSYSQNLEHKRQHHNLLLGCLLLCLLAQNKSKEFHLQVETIDNESKNDIHISSVINWEENLTEGSYQKVLSAAANGKQATPLFSCFMIVLVRSVRERICKCASSSYRNMKISEAMKLLMITNTSEFNEIAKIQGWIIDNDIVSLNLNNDNDNEFDLDSFTVIREQLSYATELERIV